MTLAFTDIADSNLLNQQSFKYQAFSNIAGYNGTLYTNKIKYYIHDQVGTVDYELFDISDCEQYAYSFSDDEEKYIIDTMNVIDNLIELDLERVDSPELASLDIYKTKINDGLGVCANVWGLKGEEYYYRSEIIIDNSNNLSTSLGMAFSLVAKVLGRGRATRAKTTAFSPVAKAKVIIMHIAVMPAIIVMLRAAKKRNRECNLGIFQTTIVEAFQIVDLCTHSVVGLWTFALLSSLML